MSARTVDRRDHRDRPDRRGNARRDDGTTLVELLVSSILIALVLVTVGLAVIGMTRTATRIQVAAATGDDARAVTDVLTRSLGAAELVNPPATVGPDVYLEARTAAGGNGTRRCTQWRVQGSTGLVQTRSWTSGATSAPDWLTVARGAVDVVAQPPFAVLAADDDWARARVVVALRLQRTAGPVVTASSVVPVVNGVGPGGGLAADPVCTELGRS